MVKNGFNSEPMTGGDPRIIERGTPEHYARMLETHIKHFIPSGWREPISAPMVPPYVEVEDWLAYKKGFDEGELSEAMESRPISSGVNRWMIREAIEAFFKRGKHNDK